MVLGTFSNVAECFGLEECITDPQHTVLRLNPCPAAKND